MAAALGSREHNLLHRAAFWGNHGAAGIEPRQHSRVPREPRCRRLKPTEDTSSAKLQGQSKAQHHPPAWQKVAANRRLRQASGWAGHPSSLLGVKPVYARSRVARTPCRCQPQLLAIAAQGCPRKACTGARCLCKMLCTLYMGPVQPQGHQSAASDSSEAMGLALSSRDGSTRSRYTSPHKAALHQDDLNKGSLQAAGRQLAAGACLEWPHGHLHTLQEGWHGEVLRGQSRQQPAAAVSVEAPDQEPPAVMASHGGVKHQAPCSPSCLQGS